MKDVLKEAEIFVELINDLRTIGETLTVNGIKKSGPVPIATLLPKNGVELAQQIRDAITREKPYWALFAAHAPDVPEWWPRQECERKKYPALDSTWTQEMREQWKGYGDWLGDDDLSPEVLASFRARREEIDRIGKENAKAERAASMATLTSWRIAYADAMVNARGH